jgi:hypothetical protein
MRLEQGRLLREVTAMFMPLLVLSLAVAGGRTVEQAPGVDAYAPMRLDLRLSCASLEVATEPVKCDVVLLADPTGGPAIVPRTWPPFRIGRWPEIVIRFTARDAAGIERWLEIAPPAGRGRYDIVKPLSEGSLLYLLPGEAHGWRYRLNGEDWLLPREPGEYRIAAELTLRLHQRDKSGHLSPGIETILRDHPELVPIVVPDGVWRSNEVVIRVSAPTSGRAKPGGT